MRRLPDSFPSSPRAGSPSSCAPSPPPPWLVHVEWGLGRLRTITNEYDVLFKAMIQINEDKHLTEEEYFPSYIKAYIDKGAELLEQEYRYSSDIYTHLLDLDMSI